MNQGVAAGNPTLENPAMHLASGYLWWKALHVAFMVTWFAGLFYLPRLFIYHVDSSASADQDRYTLMEKRLFIIMTIGAALTAIFGLLLLVINPTLAHAGWFQLKLALLLGMLIYHYRCWKWIGRLAAIQKPENTRWLRWFNEIPAFFLLAIIILAVVKPF